MSFSYPLSLPPSPGIRRVRCLSYAAVAAPRSPFSLVEQIQDWGGQLWVYEFELPPMKATGVDAGAWKATLMKLNGSYGTLLFGDPDHATPLGSVPGTPRIDGAAQTGNSINTKGWTASQTNILRAGDHFQIGSGADAQLYMNLTDANSDGAGQATLDVWPTLRSSPSDSALIYTDAPKGVFQLATNQMTWDSTLFETGISLSIVESLS